MNVQKEKSTLIFLLLQFVNVSTTVCSLKTVPQAICEKWDRYIMFIKRVYTEGTVFMTPAVVINVSHIMIHDSKTFFCFLIALKNVFYL